MKSMLTLLLVIPMFISCKPRVDSSNQNRLSSDGTKESWPGVCSGEVKSIKTASESGDLIYDYTFTKGTGRKTISSKLRHFEGLKLMVEASKKYGWSLCIDRDTSKTGVTTLDIGSATKIIFSDVKLKKKYKNTVQNFAISSEGGIEIVVGGGTYRCSAKFVGWKEERLYDGPSYIKQFIAAYRDGMSDKELNSIAKSFCHQSNLKSEDVQKANKALEGTLED